ncbi:MAG: M35 family metallo-endopeptidase, partial [Pyrinomonadaceae bacterium]|nr:M35 family metallo-endopeptidase [Pyrinomonadaceae bacterium]
LSSNPTGVVSPSYTGVETLLDLQRTHGNAFVQRLVQRKLTVSRPDDSYERKADRVADAVIREKNASSLMPGITRYEQPGVHRMCLECQEEIEHREVAGKQAVQEEESQAMPRPEMETEVARVNTLSGRSDQPALGAAVLQKQSAQAQLSTRSVGASPAIISRQKASPEETSGKQPGAGSRRRDVKKLLKDPCFGELVDDTKAQCQFSSKQSIMIRVVKESALRACSGAMAAINMPGNEERVKQIAKDYFHLDIKLSEKTKRTLIKTIKSVSGKLEHAAIECRTCHDEGCNRGLIAFVESRTVLVLCPPFFDSEIHKVYSTPRYLIHETGHLAGVNTPTRDELYCHQEATKEDKCPVVDAIHNVDAWSHFIEDVASSI